MAGLFGFGKKENSDVTASTLKESTLKEYIGTLDKVAVAFSGGLSSTYLLSVAKSVLGADRVTAITINAASMPKREVAWAVDYCSARNIKQITGKIDVFAIEGYADNNSDVDFLAKSEIIREVLSIAEGEGINTVLAACDVDDKDEKKLLIDDMNELGISNLLIKAGLIKSEIRELSKARELITWDKQSYADMSTRFPSGEFLTKEKFDRVDAVEQVLYEKEFMQFRVRVHGNIVRIEVAPDDLTKVCKDKIRKDIIKSCKDQGFEYVTLDLEGYRKGNMQHED